MPGLRPHDYDRLLELASTALELPDSPWPYVACWLREALCGAVAAFNEHPPAAGRVRVLATAMRPGVRFDPGLVEEIGRLHPLAGAIAAGDRSPRRVSDVASIGEWRRNPNYEASLHYLDGSVHHLSLPLPTKPGGVRSLIVGRPDCDFTDRDVEFATAAQRLLARIDAHHTEIQRLRAAAPGDRAPAEHDLTPRELVVLSLLGDGLTAAAIGRRLRIATSTVRKHQENLYRKLGTRDRLTTVLMARDQRLIPAPAVFSAAAHTP